MANDERTERGERRGFSLRHKLVLALLVLVALGSVAARAWIGEPAQPEARQSSLVTSLVGGGASTASGPSTPDGGERPGAAKTLPYLTEGSFFALLGFALGYASRKAVKLLLILLALAFVGLQGLIFAGVAQVDWGLLVEKLNALVLNVREGTTVTDWLADRLPSAGGLVAGYLLGFRRG